jgi:hypothetical protein
MKALLGILLPLLATPGRAAQEKISTCRKYALATDVVVAEVGGQETRWAAVPGGPSSRAARVAPRAGPPGVPRRSDL